MPFFKSMSAESGPGDVFQAYPELYLPWADTSQALMRGPSPFSEGEREMIAAFVVGTAKCQYAWVAHRAAAVAWGIDGAKIDQALEDLETADIEDRFKPVLAYARKLTLTPTEVTQDDADAVFAAGWDEKALHDAIAVTARMNFMARLVQGHGFVPMSPEKAKFNAESRKEKGYRHLYPKFRKP